MDIIYEKLPHAAHIRARVYEAKVSKLLKKTDLVNSIYAAVKNEKESIDFHLSCLTPDETDLFIEILECGGYTIKWSTVAPVGVEEADIIGEAYRACTKLTVSW
jgi:hypothetical protein